MCGPKTFFKNIRKGHSEVDRCKICGEVKSYSWVEDRVYNNKEKKENV